jgi:UDP-N-acetyl-D-glucosamine dehydrogenase
MPAFTEHSSGHDDRGVPLVRAARTTRVVVIGQGYVGLPMALHAAANDMSVIGLDTDESLVAALNSGISHVGDVSADRLGAGLTSGGYAASTDPSCIADADVVLVCVPTPLSPEGGPDLSAVESAAQAINAHVAPDTLVILESTSYPGTTEDVFAPLVLGDRLQLGQDIYIAFSPERIDPGNRAFGVRNIPKLVGGLTPDCTRAARKFYERFIDTVVEAKGAKEAEMAKLLENTFRHVNIALVNEMARFCHELDIDLWDAIDCAATKPFGYMAFRPGPGVGGHCIPIDPSYLSHHVRTRLGAAFRMVELAEEINTEAPLYVACRVKEMLKAGGRSIEGAHVLLVGITYKADVADRRESPAEPLAASLASWGAVVSYHDPNIAKWQPTFAGASSLTSQPDVYAAAARSAVVVLLQAHRDIDPDALVRASSLLLDTRGVTQPSTKAVRL